MLISGEALRLAYRAFFSLRLRQNRDGIAPTPLLNEALRVLHRACVELQMSPRRHFVADPSTPESCSDGHDSDLVDSAAAAEILGVSRRTVQRLTSSWAAPGCPGRFDLAVSPGRCHGFSRREEGGEMSMPTEYPSNWPGARPSASAPAPGSPEEALAIAVDQYIATLSQEDFDALVARTRG